MKKVMTLEEATSIAWRRGKLRHLLDETQRGMYDSAHRFYDSPNGKFFYLNCARQLGKSYLLCTLALEKAIRKPGAQVKYAAPTIKDARTIVRPQMWKLLETCPESLRPAFNHQDNEWRFPNGSVIRLAGCEGDNYQHLRGQTADLALVDEAGFIEHLEELVKSILLPQFQRTRGVLVFASTPSDTVDHYSTALARECEARGAYERHTCEESHQVSKAELEELCREYGGPESTRWRREYLAEFVTETTNAVLPSWSEERAKEAVAEWPRPKAFDSYVSIDLGYADNTGVLFGFYDFENASLVIEDEWLEARQNSGQIMAAVVEREQQLWGTQRPYRRVYDSAAGGDRFAADFHELHGFELTPALKPDLHAAVNRVDVWITHGRIRIHPRCKRLIQQLYGGSWDKTRTKFRRTESGSHYDLLAALVYLVRHVDEFHNPFTPERPSLAGMWVPPDYRTEGDDSLASAFEVNLG
jgi:hypothetical protein